MRSLVELVLLAPAAALAVAGCTGMQQGAATPPKPAVGFGKPITEADIAPWNIDIRTSDGRGLPAGRGTVAEGKKVYDAKCLSCHGADAKGGPVYGAMVGGIGSFTTNTRVLTPGSMYPYAPILFDYIRRAMPMDRPQTLTVNEVYAVSAYLLNLNGLIPADAVMDQNTLPKVQMPNRSGFIVDDRPDAKAVRCMTGCK
jgi:cytochrome c